MRMLMARTVVLLAAVIGLGRAAAEGDTGALSPGKHLFMGISGPQLNEAERALIREVQPAGIVLLGANVRDADQTRALSAAIKEAAGNGNGIADWPLIAVDQEGGRINRLKLASAPSAGEIGASGDPIQARDAGKRYAEACRERGIAILLAPVLDLGSGDGNAVIGDRAFAGDPAIVATMGLAFARGVMEGGALPCGKHFPGHGTARQDSHHMLAVMNESGDALTGVLSPFKTAAKTGLPLLMSGHIAAPGLGEPTTPASMSSRLLRELVRHDWGYEGVLITDDMNMGAIASSPGDAAVEALLAGNDAVMYLNPRPGHIRSIVAAIAAATDAGVLSREELGRSEKRLNALADWLRVNAFLANTTIPALPETAASGPPDAVKPGPETPPPAQVSEPAQEEPAPAAAGSEGSTEEDSGKPVESKKTKGRRR